MKSQHTTTAEGDKREEDPIKLVPHTLEDEPE
jgi:hypothetical protein